MKKRIKNRMPVRVLVCLVILMSLAGCKATDIDREYDLESGDSGDEWYRFIAPDEDGAGGLVLLGPRSDIKETDYRDAEGTEDEDIVEETQALATVEEESIGSLTDETEGDSTPVRSREDIDREDEEIRQALGLTEERIASLIGDNTGNYYFDHLDETGKRLYAEILHITEVRGEKIKISSLDEREIDTAFQYMMADHPEIFYADGYTYTRFTIDGELIKLGFTARYVYDADETDRRTSLMEEVIGTIVEAAPKNDDQYETAKYVYERIIEMTDYEVGAPDNQNICSVFLSGISVCQGYSKAAQLLLNRLGVRTTLVTGTVSAGDRPEARHAWNLTWVNENSYFLDVTWGDSSFQQAASEDTLTKRINYDYLLDTSEDLADTHITDDLVEIPVCDHLEDNYYVRDGAYFASADPDQISALFDKAYAEGRSSLTLKCADKAAYSELTQVLITDRGLFDYLRTEDNSASFASSDTQRTLTFVL